jgi:SAM-dependent methyltransferase
MNMIENIKNKLLQIQKKVKPENIVLEEMQEMVLNREETQEIQEAVRDIDTGYLLHSSEIVGYDTREHQWNTYRTVMMYMGEGDSVLDYGCGRGDFKAVYDTEMGAQLDYIGLELNQAMIDAAAELYPDYQIQKTDWFKIPAMLTADWCVNIHSLNLRYDADLTKNDMEYKLATIKHMYEHANKGVIVMLASDIVQKDDGLLATNPGKMLNYAQKEFGNVAIDHTFSDELFALIIYKS